MLDKSESFFGKKQKFKLEHKGKTVAVSVVDDLAVEGAFGVRDASYSY